MKEMIDPQTRVFVILLSMGVLLYVINLVRTRKLREEFALLWVATGILLVAAALLVDWVDALSYALGIEYPPAFLFLIAFLCLLFICFQFSVNISRLADQNKVLVQELALLVHRVEELERALDEPQETEEAS